MAVLKSPKNVKRKPLWVAKLRQSTKKNLFYFYESENRFRVSPRSSSATRGNYIMDPLKYRGMPDDSKRRRRLEEASRSHPARVSELSRLTPSILAGKLRSLNAHPSNRVELSLVLYDSDFRA